MLFSAILLLFAISRIQAAVISRPHDHAHENDIYDKPLPSVWYQREDHPVHSLFRRAPGDGTAYPAVGSPAWSSTYPPGGAIPTVVPPEWTAALNAAVSAGKIPNIPNSPYPPGIDPNGPQVCSAAVFCKIPGDHFDGPDGIYASSFDDGPYPASNPSQITQLVQFLSARNLTTTHFMIGGNILMNPTHFLTAFDAGHDIAVHTWSHPHMTTLSNAAVVAELGWTMQLIHNSTGGRVPRYWRPPYGDSDMRTRAIAREVFGLETVIWNSDSADWTTGSAPQIAASLTQILSTRPKSPGLITLEHDISDADVTGFIAAFPAIASNGWQFASLARALGDGRAYQNANSSTSEVSKKGVLVVDVALTSSTIPPSPSVTISSSPTPSAAQRTSSNSPLRLSYSCSLFLSTILSTVVFLTL